MVQYFHHGVASFSHLIHHKLAALHVALDRVRSKGHQCIYSKVVTGFGPVVKYMGQILHQIQDCY